MTGELRPKFDKEHDMLEQELAACAKAFADILAMREDPVYQAFMRWRQRAEQLRTELKTVCDSYYMKPTFDDIASGHILFPARYLKDRQRAVVGSISRDMIDLAIQAEQDRNDILPDVKTYLELSDRLGGLQARINLCLASIRSKMESETWQGRPQTLSYFAYNADAAMTFEGESGKASEAVSALLKRESGMPMAELWHRLDSSLGASKPTRQWRSAQDGLRQIMGLSSHNQEPKPLQSCKGRLVLDLPIWPTSTSGDRRKANTAELMPLVHYLIAMVEWSNVTDIIDHQVKTDDLKQLLDWLQTDDPCFTTGTRKPLWQGAVLVLQFNRVRIEMSEVAAMLLNLFVDADALGQNA